MLVKSGTQNNKDINWIYNARTGEFIAPISGGGAANVGQNAVYAFGDDDGNEAAHTLDSENTDRAAQIPDVTFMIRIQVEENNGGNGAFLYSLYAQKNGAGGFAAVTTTSTNGIIIANDTQSRADDENTTERLTAGAGAWQAGKYDDGQTQNGTTSFTCQSEYSEVEVAIQIDSTYASDGDYFELRFERADDGTDLDFYPGTYPKVTASIAGNVVVTPDAASAVGATVAPTVVLASMTVTATEASAVGATVNPTVVLASMTVTATEASAVGATVNPTVVQSSMAVAPTEASAVGATENPTVVQSSMTVTATEASAVGATENPTVNVSGLEITPTASAAVGATVNPTVVLASMVVVPAAVSAVGATANPIVILGSLAVIPTAASAVGVAVDPTVVVAGGAVVKILTNFGHHPLPHL